MESFKQMQQLVSPKLTWEIFEDLLKKQHDSNSVSLLSVTMGKSTKKGDSYLSAVTRFSIEYSGEKCGCRKVHKLHVIAKSLLKNIAQRKTFRNSDFFTNEIVFYDQVWPQFDAFQRKMKPKALFQEIPNYLYGCFDGTNDYILLEDLSFQNYQSVNRADALTFETAKVVLRILAHFHAIGFTFKETEPELFHQTVHKLKETYFHEDFRSWYEKFHNNLKSITLDAVEQELPKAYSEKFKEILKQDFYGETIKLCSPSSTTKYKTIVHGDTWMPNFLTRFDDSNQPLHSVMIDYQLTRCASLAQDLHFFIYACTDVACRERYYEQMMKYYCQEFNAFVGQLGPQLLDVTTGIVLSYDALINELKANGSFALCMSMEASIMSMLEDDEVSDLDKIEGEDVIPLDVAWVVKPLKVKEKRIKLAQIVKHLMDYNFI